MPTKSWKSWELRVSKLFGCRRRGPIFRSPDGGTDDLTHDWYAVECKLLSRPTYGEMLAACKQAEAAAPVPFRDQPGDFRMREPIAIVKKKGALDDDALVIQRLGTFKAWHL